MGKLEYSLAFNQEYSYADDSVYVFNPSVRSEGGTFGEFYLTGVATGSISVRKSDNVGASVISVYIGYLDGKWHLIGSFSSVYLGAGRATLTNFIYSASEATKGLIEEKAPSLIRLTCDGKNLRLPEGGSFQFTASTEPKNKASAFSIDATVEAGKVIGGSVEPFKDGNRHKITIKLDNTRQQVLNLAAGVKTFSYAIPENWCYGILNSTKAQAVCIVETIDAAAKVLGNTQKNFTVSVPASIIPSIRAFELAPQNPNNVLGGTYVQSKSVLTAKLEASLAYNSPITSWTVTGGGLSFTGNGAPSAAVWNKIGTLTGSGNITVKLTIKDGRGRTRTAELSINVLAYQPPRITSALVYRSNSAGTYDEGGTTLYFKVAYTYTTLGSVNTLRASASYREKGATAWIGNVTLSQNIGSVVGVNAISLTKAYEAAIDLKDVFGTITTIYNINMEEVAFEIMQDRAAFGTRATKGGAMQINPGWGYHGRSVQLNATDKNQWYQFLTIKDSDDNVLGYFVMDHQNNATSPGFGIRVISRNSNGTLTGHAEAFILPNPDIGRTSGGFYSILTSKNLITIAQGGTGANSAAGARKNLGIPNIQSGYTNQKMTAFPTQDFTITFPSAFSRLPITVFAIEAPASTYVYPQVVIRSRSLTNLQARLYAPDSDQPGVTYAIHWLAFEQLH